MWQAKSPNHEAVIQERGQEKSEWIEKLMSQHMVKWLRRMLGMVCY